MTKKITILFRFVLGPLLLALLLLQCKKPNDAPVTPTPPIATTPAAPLTEEAISQTGLLELPKEEYEKIPLYVAKSYKGGRQMAITAIDLSADMPLVGDQSNQGSCTAWATAYAIRSFLYHQDSKKPYLLSDGKRNDDVVFSPSFVYNQINNGKDRGSYPVDAFRLMMSEGVCSLKDMPYNSTDFISKPTENQKQKAAGNKILGFGRTLITLESLKACLSAGLPVQASIRLNTSFGRLDANSTIGGEYVFKPPASRQSTGSHAVVLVGFDDSKNSFKVMNSWGNGWGNKGFFWMDYSSTDYLIFEAYVAFTTSIQSQFIIYEPPAVVNTGAGTWVSKADYPGSDQTSSNSVAFTIDNIIYICGRGENDTYSAWQGRAEVYTYNPATNVWGKKAAKLPSTNNKPGSYQAYNGMAAFVIDKKAYLVTGFGVSDANFVKRLYEYEPAKDTWTEKKPLPFDKGETRRFAVVSVSYNGKGYFGFNSIYGKKQYGREFWEYDPAADSWLLKTTMPEEFDVGTTASSGVIGDKLYLTNSQGNGTIEQGNTLLYEYDFTKNTWAKKKSLADYNIRYGGVSAVIDGQLYCGLQYIKSGTNKSGTNFLFAYNPQKDTWTKVKDLPAEEGRNYPLGVVANGKLYAGLGYKSASTGPVTYLTDWWEFKP